MIEVLIKLFRERGFDVDFVMLRISKSEAATQWAISARELDSLPTAAFFDQASRKMAEIEHFIAEHQQ